MAFVKGTRVMLRCLFFLCFTSFLPHCSASAKHEKKSISFTVDSVAFKALVVAPENVNIHWKSDDGESFGSFGKVYNTLEKQNKAVISLMNAGIYDTADQPAGLHIENGNVLRKLNSNKGSGNFHLEPNGVFFIDHNDRAKIVTTKRYKQKYQRKQSAYKLATQSGPMMLVNGTINRKFLPKSTSVYSRNGVCTSQKGVLHFISTDNSRSNLYQFAQAMRKVGCHNGLYLDGNISKMYINGENGTFHFSHFVGILSVTTTHSDN